LKVGPVINAGPGTVAAPPAPTYLYVHGDSNWYPPVTKPAGAIASVTQSSASGQSGPSVSDQYRQLVQGRNQNGATQLGQPQIAAGSIAEIARQVRAEKATEEKPKVMIKQDAEGKPEIIYRNQ